MNDQRQFGPVSSGLTQVEAVIGGVESRQLRPSHKRAPNEAVIAGRAVSIGP